MVAAAWERNATLPSAHGDHSAWSQEQGPVSMPAASRRDQGLGERRTAVVSLIRQGNTLHGTREAAC
jgi:hypothetical protein